MYSVETGQGDGPALVLLHALAMDHSMWHGVVARLAPGRRVIAVDVRGHGKTPAATRPWRAADVAAEIADWLDRLELPVIDLCGCSMGGTLAMEFANRFPARVRHLVVIDASGNYGEGAKPKWRERGQAAVDGGMHRLIDFQIERWFSPAFIKQRPGLVADTLRVFLSNEVEAYSNACDMLANANAFAYPSPSLASVTVIVGEDDYATPISAAQEIVDFYPHATLSVIPKTRHFTPIEAPDAVASILDKTLAR